MPSLNGMSITNGATGLTLTGGTALTFGRVSSDNNGIIVAAASEPYTTRTTILFKAKPQKLQSDGSYSKLKRQVQLTRPKILADGKPTFGVVRFDVEAHPDFTDAEIISMVLCACQCYMDSDCADFRTSGSMQ